MDKLRKRKNSDADHKNENTEFEVQILKEKKTQHGSLRKLADPVIQPAMRLLTAITSLFSTYPRVVVTLFMLGSSYGLLRRREDWMCFAKFWDGPNYMYVAKTLYSIPEDHPLKPYNLTPSYFSCHLPAFPLVIRFMAETVAPFVANDGKYVYTVAMILATLATSVMSALMLHHICREFKLTRNPTATACFFALVPFRFLVYHTVGASEPLFLFFVFAAVWAYRKEKWAYLMLAVMGASLTRITGVLLGPAFEILLLARRKWKGVFVLPFSAVGILCLFWYYKVIYGDFWAYFSYNMDKAGLVRNDLFGILRVYTQHPDASGSGMHSAEHYGWLYMIYGLGTLSLWQHKDLFMVSLSFFIMNCYMFHIDLARYFLPAAPFAILVAFDSLLSQRQVWLIGLPLMAYLSNVYAHGQLNGNQIVDWVWGNLLNAIQQP